jgi:branched-chain amino acid transport system substrate-binding protein
MPMKRPILVGGLVLSLFFVVTHAPAKETIKLGLITPLTGDVKTFGESCRNAFLLAIEDYSKTGKYQIAPFIADDRNDATEGTNAALKLITQDKVAGIIGPLTSKIAIPVSEIADKNRVPMISSATNPKVTVFDGKRKPYVFRSCFTDPFQGSVAANFALKNLKASTAAVLYDVGNDFSKGLADFFKTTFEKSKGTILAYESYQKDDVDFSALITKIGVKRPDVIFLPDYYNKVSLIARQVREKGLKSALLGGDGWDSPDLIKIGGSAILGSYFTNHYSAERKDKVAEAFTGRYKQKYGAVPDAWAALTYDATMLYLQSLDQAKKATPEEVMKVLTDLKNFKGATGNISFDRNGDPVKSAVILRVEKDGFKYVTTVTP